MVQNNDMARKSRVSEDTVRSSISFPKKIYATLEELAIVKKVSLAWVVRDAVESYLDKQNEGKIKGMDAKNV